MPSTQSFTVNGRTYQPPSWPVVVICLDGSSDEYFDAAQACNRMPHLQRIAISGYRGLARAAMPTFTNVNNSSIVTGVPPSVHGIGGNFFYDPTTGQEVMMNSAKFLRAETIFRAATIAGRRVAIVTAKEKLRNILASGLMPTVPISLSPLIYKPSGIAFSSEKANEARLTTHGIEGVEGFIGCTPGIYSGEASLYVLKAGVKLIETGLADFLYLSTTDYMQHKYAPDAPESVSFYAAIDEQLGRLLELGAVVGLTADHGMNAKQKADGSPNVLYLESLLTETFEEDFRVILPITDPYVVHHGALGSFAVIHVPPAVPVNAVRDWLFALNGVTEVHDRNSAAKKLELPADRLGELVVISGRDVVLGRTPEYHNLKALEGPLRSHGGRYEEMVPFIFSHPLKREYAAKAAGDPRNFDVFDFACNGTAASADAHG